MRIKERYLLVNILYPRDGTPIKKNPGDGKEIPDFVAIRHATQSDLTPQLLLRAIKAETLALFGDCGAGSVERTLSGKLPGPYLTVSVDDLDSNQFSQILQPLNVHLYSPHHA